VKVKLPAVAFVTWKEVPDLTPDDQLAIAPLAEQGYRVVAEQWDDPAVQWRDYAAVVIRSCWDYHHRASEFSTWVNAMEAQEIALWNPAPLIRWNMDKSYLRELAADGINIPSAVFLDAGETASPLHTILERQNWDRAVVKPTISGSAYSTWPTDRSQARGQESLFREMLARGGVMVQRFESDITTAGEWSLIYLGGILSHAVLKRPAAGDFRVQKEHGGTSELASPKALLVQAAEQVLTKVRYPWLYARVDLVESRDKVLLMELEMLEPDLFLRFGPGAPERFAEAIGRVAGGVMAKSKGIKALPL
jgi:glutathione synthase/RimK-type ligase-like ATP-grasp enzyme